MENDIRKVKLQKLKNLQEAGMEVYPEKSEKSHQNQEVLNDFDNIKGKVFLTGRVVSLRPMGGSAFVNIEDESGKIQLFLNKKNIDGDKYKLFVKNIELGDFIQVEGELFETKTGEKSLQVSDWKILSKTIESFPTEYFGFKNEEEKFRKRYLDLFFNKKEKEVFVRRARFWKAIRDFMVKEGFLEVETPSIETTTGGAEARPFKTYHNDFDISVYMRICVGELWQKRLMAAGFEKTFEVGRAFRNEGTSPDHLQEFTNMEFYWAYADYKDGMKLVQEMYKFIAKEVYGVTKFETRGHKFDLADEWKEIDYVDEIKKQAKIDIAKASERELKEKLEELEVKYDGGNKERYIDSLWKHCRKNISGPAFLINHPTLISPLAKEKSDVPGKSARFQILLAGAEVGNGYSELNDPVDQRKRFEEQQKLIESGDEEAMMPDWEFVEMLEYGMPPTCGFGVGERLFAFLENKTLREVTLFPLVKPKKEDASGKTRETQLAVALINKESKMEPWQEMNTIAHLNASFASREGESLLEQDEITTKDDKKIKLNIQNAIMIKEAKDNKEIIDVINKTNEFGLKIVEFTRDMLETSDDLKLIKDANKRKFNDFEYLGVLVFGKKSVVEKLTKKFELYK